MESTATTSKVVRRIGRRRFSRRRCLRFEQLEERNLLTTAIFQDGQFSVNGEENNVLIDLSPTTVNTGEGPQVVHEVTVNLVWRYDTDSGYLFNRTDLSCVDPETGHSLNVCRKGLDVSVREPKSLLAGQVTSLKIEGNRDIVLDEVTQDVTQENWWSLDNVEILKHGSGRVVGSEWPNNITVEGSGNQDQLIIGGGSVDTITVRGDATGTIIGGRGDDIIGGDPPIPEGYNIGWTPGDGQDSIASNGGLRVSGEGMFTLSREGDATVVGVNNDQLSLTSIRTISFLGDTRNDSFEISVDAIPSNGMEINGGAGDDAIKLVGAIDLGGDGQDVVSHQLLGAEKGQTLIGSEPPADGGPVTEGTRLKFSNIAKVDDEVVSKARNVLFGGGDDTATISIGTEETTVTLTTPGDLQLGFPTPSDTLNVLAGSGMDRVRISSSLDSFGELVVLGQSGKDHIDLSQLQFEATIDGGQDDDTLVGGVADDSIDGGSGHDTIDGGDGFNECRNGEDVINCDVDFVWKQLEVDGSRGGVSYVYEVRGSNVGKPTTLEFFWSSKPHLGEVIGAAVVSIAIPADQTGDHSGHIPETTLLPPPGARHLVGYIDPPLPDNPTGRVTEVIETNNAASLPIFVTPDVRMIVSPIFPLKKHPYALGVKVTNKSFTTLGATIDWRELFVSAVPTGLVPRTPFSGLSAVLVPSSRFRIEQLAELTRDWDWIPPANPVTAGNVLKGLPKQAAITTIKTAIKDVADGAIETILSFDKWISRTATALTTATDLLEPVRSFTVKYNAEVQYGPSEEDVVEKELPVTIFVPGKFQGLHALHVFSNLGAAKLFGLGVKSLLASPLTGGVSGSVSAGLFAGAAATWAISGLSYTQAVDPPDADYTVLLQPTDADTSSISAMPNGLIRMMSQDLLRLASMKEVESRSRDKAHGAQLADSPEWASAQFKAASDFAFDALDIYTRLIGNISLQPLSGFDVAVSDNEATKHLAEQGLPELLVSNLSQLGWSAEAIESLNQTVRGSAELDGTTEDLPTFLRVAAIETAASAHADLLDAVNARVNGLDESIDAITAEERVTLDAAKLRIENGLAQKLPSTTLRAEIRDFLADVRELIIQTNNLEVLGSDLDFGLGATLVYQSLETSLPSLARRIETLEAEGGVDERFGESLTRQLEQMEQYLATNSFVGFQVELRRLLANLEDARGVEVAAAAADRLIESVEYIVHLVDRTGAPTIVEFEIAGEQRLRLSRQEEDLLLLDAISETELDQVPLQDINAYAVRTDAGSDQLEIDFSGGEFSQLADGLLFLAGVGGNDNLRLAGGSADLVTHLIVNNESGAVQVDVGGDGALSKISYDGIGPLVDDLDTSLRSFSFGDDANAITLAQVESGGQPHQLTLELDGLEAITFTQQDGIVEVAGANGDDVLTAVNGFPLPVVFDGGRGRDTLTGTDHDDVLRLADFDADEVNGRGGQDTLQLTGDEVSVDLRVLAEGQLESIESVDLAAPGSHSISLDAPSVLNLLGGSDSLLVIADKEDQVSIGPDWTLDSTRRQDGRFVRVLTLGNATLLMSGPHDWANPVDPLDVNGNGSIEPLDALNVINELNDRQISDANGKLPDAATLAEFPGFFFDVSPDGSASPLDALIVINFLNDPGTSDAEAEGVALLFDDLSVRANGFSVSTSEDRQVTMQANSSYQIDLDWHASVQQADGERMMAASELERRERKEIALLDAIEELFAEGTWLE